VVLRPRSRSTFVARALRAAAFALLAAACTDREAPEALVGHWMPQDPRYEGRSLDITPTTIKLGQGGMRSALYPIEAIESVPGDGGGTLHELFYRNVDGDTAVMRFLTLPGSPATLRFENHDDLWVRDGEPGRTTRGAS